MSTAGQHDEPSTVVHDLSRGRAHFLWLGNDGHSLSRSYRFGELVKREEMLESAADFNAAKARARRSKIQARQDKGQGAAFFSQYKRIPSGAQDEFRRLMEEDWREHRKFDADPSEEIIDAEVIEE